MLRCRAAGQTDKGCQRLINVDSFYISPDSRLFAVADGMGHHGILASSLATETVAERWRLSHRLLMRDDTIAGWLIDTINCVNDSICSMGEENSSLSDTLTTAVVAVLSDSNHLHVAHVGDSSASLVRGGVLRQLTNDHSPAYELERSGRLTKEQANLNPYKGFIGRMLGMDRKVEVDHVAIDIQVGDWLTVCSDGLTRVLTAEQIAAVVANFTPINETIEPGDICEKLVEHAIEGGGPDNITVIAVNFVDEHSAALFC